MDVENTFIKPILTHYFGKGLNEYETQHEISKQYSQFVITLKTIKKWYKVFKRQSSCKYNRKKGDDNSNIKTNDQYLVDLVKDNPLLNMIELAKLCKTSRYLISKRIKEINSKGEIQVNYKKKNAAAKLSKFTNKDLLIAINNNPELSMKKLGELMGCSKSTISIRLKKINSKRVDNDKVCLNSNKNNSNKNNSNKNNSNKKLFTDDSIVEKIIENPSISRVELSNQLNCSVSTIYIRLKQINSSRPIDNKLILEKLPRNAALRTSKFSDDYLIKLVKNNPSLNMRELAKIADCSKSTISKRLKEVNKDGVKVNYINKYNQPNNGRKRSEKL